MKRQRLRQEKRSHEETSRGGLGCRSRSAVSVGVPASRQTGSLQYSCIESVGQRAPCPCSSWEDLKGVTSSELPFFHPIKTISEVLLLDGSNNIVSHSLSLTPWEAGSLCVLLGNGRGTLWRARPPSVFTLLSSSPPPRSSIFLFRRKGTFPGSYAYILILFSTQTHSHR